MFSAGHGTRHCHCHSTGLPHVPGQELCCETWSLECNCCLAGHPQHSVPRPGSPGSCQARQKHILNEGSGHQHGCCALGEGGLWLSEGSFCPEGTAALLAIDQAPPKYGSARESYKSWILAAHAGWDDTVAAQQLFQQLVPG